MPLQIWPALASGEIVNLEYYSTNPIASADGATRKPRFTADTDFVMFPEGVLTRGMIWRWKQSKGLEYAEDFRTWNISGSFPGFSPSSPGGLARQISSVKLRPGSYRLTAKTLTRIAVPAGRNTYLLATYRPNTRVLRNNE